MLSVKSEYFRTVDVVRATGTREDVLLFKGTFQQMRPTALLVSQVKDPPSVCFEVPK